VFKSRELERLATTFGWVPPPQSKLHLPELPNQYLFVSSVKSAYADETCCHYDEMAANSWWFTTRNAILWRTAKELLQGSALWDVGGGSGVVARFLISQDVDVVLVEPSKGGATIAHQEGVPSLCATLEQLHLPDACLPAVGMFDVLEHLEDREQALNEIRRVLIPGGLLLLTLPALSSLWSGYDVIGGHYLRYNKRSIRNQLERHGFEIQRIGYFFAMTVLPAYLIRVVPYRLGFQKPIAQDIALSASGGVIGRIAAMLERWLAMRTPIGSSLLVVARKRTA
jgi:ubiquinone/menaquinone biosynthesis C-methylase UbiE